MTYMSIPYELMKKINSQLLVLPNRGPSSLWCTWLVMETIGDQVMDEIILNLLEEPIMLQHMN